MLLEIAPGIITVLIVEKLIAFGVLNHSEISVFRCSKGVELLLILAILPLKSIEIVFSELFGLEKPPI